jgi:SAM-dependent methyltransferase
MKQDCDVRFSGTKEIKEHVSRVLDAKGDGFKNQRALDFPAGNGVTSTALKKLGAEVLAIDLIPELFRSEGVPVLRGDLSSAFPCESSMFNFAVCQEGIEHVGNQDHVLREFARVMKVGGRLLLTTPNYSNLKSKVSYLLTESEAFGRIMPPNETDSIWLAPTSPGESTPRLYFGHTFLTGFFRLRLFAKLAGLRLVQIHDSRVNSTSLLLFPLLYPFVCLSAFKTVRRFKRKGGQKELADELFRWMVSPRLLLENHLILEFEKIDVNQMGSTSPAAPAKADLASFRT